MTMLFVILLFTFAFCYEKLCMVSSVLNALTVLCFTSLINDHFSFSTRLSFSLTSLHWTSFGACWVYCLRFLYDAIADIKIKLKKKLFARWFSYLWVTSRKKLERSNNYFSSYSVKIFFFLSFTLTYDLYFREKKIGFECLYGLWIQSVAPCGCSSQKAACGGARRGWQYPFGPNMPRGKNGMFELLICEFNTSANFLNYKKIITKPSSSNIHICVTEMKKIIV